MHTLPGAVLGKMGVISVLKMFVKIYTWLILGNRFYFAVSTISYI